MSLPPMTAGLNYALSTYVVRGDGAEQMVHHTLTGIYTRDQAGQMLEGCMKDDNNLCTIYDVVNCTAVGRLAARL